MIEETGWLIERGETKPEVIMYFGFLIVVQHDIEIKHWSWTTDPNQATRFARKQDAELTWQCATQRPLEDVDVVEHMWCDYAHKWHVRVGLECCSECGVVRRADDRNGPCRGPVHLGLRASTGGGDGR